MAVRSKAQVCSRSPAEIVGSNPTGAWMFVCCECCVLSGRGLCNELITHPEESYRLWCVVVCDLETSWMRRLWPTRGCCAKRKKKSYVIIYGIGEGEKNFFLLTSHLCCNVGDMLTHTEIMDYFYLTLSHTITNFALEYGAVVIKFTYICILLYTKYLCITVSYLMKMPLENNIFMCSWRIEDQFDVTCYFISLLMCSTCFGH